MLWKGIPLTVQFGRDLDHDPVTGTNTSKFGDAPCCVLAIATAIELIGPCCADRPAG